MSLPRFRIRTLMIAVACIGVWLGFSRTHLVLGAGCLVGIEVACLILTQRQYFRLRGVARSPRLTGSDRARLLALSVLVGRAFGPLYDVTFAISRPDNGVISNIPGVNASDFGLDHADAFSNRDYPDVITSIEDAPACHLMLGVGASGLPPDPPKPK